MSPSAAAAGPVTTARQPELGGVLKTWSSRDLLQLHSDVLEELKRRKVVRTANGPAGDNAELLFALAFDGGLAPRSEKSWDVRVPDGRLIQVKARRLSVRPAPGERQLSPIRSWGFDQLAVVLFAPNFSVQRAVLLGAAHAKAQASYRQHVNGHVLLARDSLWSLPGASDITGPLSSVIIASADAGR